MSYELLLTSYFLLPQRLVLLPCIEARARLWAVVAVSCHTCEGIASFQFTYESDEGLLLLWCSGVGWLSVGVQSALVADADAVLVHTCAVCSCLAFRSAKLDCAVSAHHVVIAYHSPSLRLVPSVNLLHRARLVGLHR